MVKADQINVSQHDVLLVFKFLLPREEFVMVQERLS